MTKRKKLRRMGLCAMKWVRKEIEMARQNHAEIGKIRNDRFGRPEYIRSL